MTDWQLNGSNKPLRMLKFALMPSLKQVLTPSRFVSHPPMTGEFNTMREMDRR